MIDIKYKIWKYLDETKDMWMSGKKTNLKCCIYYKLWKNLSKSQVYKENEIIINKFCKKKVHLNISGKNNYINIENIIGNGRLSLSVAGDNCKIDIGAIYLSCDMKIVLGQEHPNFGKIHDITLKIGKDSSFESIKIITFNSNTKISIGENCMFSYGVTIYNTDGHPIYEKGTDKIINKVNDLIIGNHVWCGAEVTILKNTTIADDCILGWGGVISGKFLTTNCIIAGNPAQEIRCNIDWNVNGSKGYVQNGRD